LPATSFCDAKYTCCCFAAQDWFQQICVMNPSINQDFPSQHRQEDLTTTRLALQRNTPAASSPPPD
jgi:hypothetical protein